MLLLAAPALAQVTFTQVFPTTSPAPRRSSGMAEQYLGPGQGRHWIFGGFDGSQRADLHYFDAATLDWVSVTGTNTPSARERHALGWDPLHQRLVLFGGFAQTGPFSFTHFNEVQVFDPATSSWTLYAPAGAGPPAGRADVSLAWAPSLQGFLVFGGNGDALFGSSFFNDLWLLELDPQTSTATWSQPMVTGASPTARGAACVVFDTGNDQLVVFGGQSSGSGYLNDLNLFSVAGGSWAPVVAGGSPPTPRGFIACAYLSGAQSVLVHGGQSGNNPVGGTFVLGLSTATWLAVGGTSNPGVRSDAAATFSRSLNGMLLFGGRVGSSTYDNQTWLGTVGGGGNQPPVADAGADFTAAEDVLVTLQGGGTDPDLDPLTWQWSQTAGPQVTLSSATAQSPTFTSPRVTLDTPLTFELVAHDDTVPSAPDAVVVTVQDTLNEPPVASAGPDQQVADSAQVTLDGTASTDPNGETLAFQWTQLQGPAVTLSDPAVAQPTFTAPHTAAGATLELTLTATDPRMGSSVDAVVVTVAANLPPVASAGMDLQTSAGLPVVLNGTGSVDPEGMPLTYAWQQTSGPPVTLQGATTATAAFIAPTLPDDSTLQFSLLVTDDLLATASDSVGVSVTGVGEPDAGMDAGMEPDAGEGQDAGTSTEDGGMGDAGEPADAGPHDAGEDSDAGVTPGQEPWDLRVGVGCAAAPVEGLASLLALLALALRRRR